MPALPTPSAVVTVSIADILGPAAQGSVEFQLCGFGSLVPRVPNIEVLVDVAPDPVDPDVDGLVTINLWPNNSISPADTYYLVTFNDDNGDPVQVAAYRFSGNGPFDLSVYPQIDPDNPGPVPPVYLPRWLDVPSVAGIVTYDGSQVSSISGGFHTTLTEDVTVVIRNMQKGVPYFVCMEQGAPGGFTVTWPNNFGGAISPVNPDSGAITQQAAIGSIDGLIDPGGWTATGGGIYLP